MRTRFAPGIASVVLGAIVAFPVSARSQDYGILLPRHDVSGIPTAQRSDVEPLSLRSDGAEAWTPPQETVWYGWQTLLVDAAAMTMLYGSVKSHTPSLAWVGLGIYAFGAPTVHAWRGHGDKLNGDIAVRILAPFIGALLASVSLPPSEPTCRGRSSLYRQEVDGMRAGAAGGAVAAILVDAFGLAFDTEPADPSAIARSATRWPVVAVAQHGGTVGVGGAF
jgi:hypothetical protein